jgi:hypothetical protein
MICPNCGGKLIGDGMRTPVQCEFAEVEGVEVDAGPFYCAPKFTPGPWSINTDPRYNNGEPWDIWGPKGPGYGIVANVAPWCPPRPHHGDYLTTKANANLIAAAPELYKALRYLVSAIDFEGETQHYDSVYCLCVEQARNAIAKAEGR